MRIPPHCLIAGERSTLYAMSERKVRDVAAEEREADAERIARDAEHVAAAGQGETAAVCASSPTCTLAMADSLRDRQEHVTDE